MSRKTIQAIQPTYYKYFQCDPVACQETCCQRWQIFVDRETCLRYINSPHPAIQALAKTGISLNPDALGLEDYAVINMNKELFCPFLNEDDLCEIVLQMGDESLSTTCRTFPRSIRRIGDTLERGLVMSCSVACELALKDPAGIEFEQVEADLDVDAYNVNIFTEYTEDQLFIGLGIGRCMIAIMQNRELELGDRVWRIGCFLDLVDRELQDKQVLMDELDGTLADLLERALKLAGPEIHNNEQFHHLNQILSMKFQDGDSIRFFSSRYVECLMPVLDAFGGLDEKDAESLYRKGEIEYFQPFIKEKGYLLENYLVNYLFVFCHDFFDGERRWEGYLKFALIFGLMKFNMIGLGLAYQGLGQDLVLKLIQSLAKTFVPDRQYFYSALQYMKKENLMGLEGVHALIGND